jgi:ribosomal protein S12 methylthiotransferase accessory factor
MLAMIKNGSGAHDHGVLRRIEDMAGLVSVFEIPRELGGIDFFCATALPNPALWQCDRDALAMAGSGVGTSYDVAFEAAIGEAVERCSILEPAMDLRYGSWKGLGGEALHPSKLEFFRDDQYALPEFPFQRFSEAETLPWVLGESLCRHASTWLPAEAVFLEIVGLQRRHLYATSNGAAAAARQETAILKGLYELIERDALMRAWFLMRGIRALCTKTLPPGPARSALDRVCATGLAVHCYELESDVGIPVFLAITESRFGLPTFACGAAASVDAIAALTKAILESAHTWTLARTLLQARGALSSGVRPAEFLVQSFHDHVYLYSHPFTRPSLSFILDASPTPWNTARQTAASHQNPLAFCVERLRQLQLEVLYCDVTRPEFRTFGYHVVRVLVPGLVPLSVGAGCPYLGGPRMLSYGPTNPNPHPFP